MYCTKCGTKLADGANFCAKCGLSVAAPLRTGAGSQQEADIANTIKKIAGRRNMLIGGIVCAVGILISVGTHAAAKPEGQYLLAWGAILFGVIQFIRGLFQWMSS